MTWDIATYHRALEALGLTDAQMQETIGPFKADPPPVSVEKLLALMTRYRVAQPELAAFANAPFSHDDYRAAIETLGLGLREVSRWLKVDERTARRWGYQNQPPKSVQSLMLMMIARRMKPAQVDRLPL